MNNRLMGLFIEFDEMGFEPTTVCPNPEETAVEWKERVSKEINELESENKLLKRALEDACRYIRDLDFYGACNCCVDEQYRLVDKYGHCRCEYCFAPDTMVAFWMKKAEEELSEEENG